MARHITNKKLYLLTKELKRYKEIKKIIRHDEKLLDEGYMISGINYDKVVIQKSNKFNSDTENQLFTKIEIENRLKTNKTKIKRIDLALELLDDEELMIVREYYINDCGWISTARKIGTSERNARRIRDAAIIKMFEGLYGERLCKGYVQYSLNGF